MESTALSNVDVAGRLEMGHSGHLPIAQSTIEVLVTLGRCQQINGQQAASDTGKHEHVFYPGFGIGIKAT